MQKQGGPAPDLIVRLELAEPVVVGLSTLATVRLTNRGTGPATVSSRLNLMEGDLRLSVQGPDGVTRVIKGWQADTPLRRVTLRPGEEIVGVVNLLFAGDETIFPEPGRYQLRAEYTPSPRAEPVASPPISVIARLARTDAEREAAALLQDESLRQAVVAGKTDVAPNKLEELAATSTATPDARLAKLMLSDNRHDADEPAATDSTADPLETALLIAALSTPYSNVGKRLADRFAARLESGDATTSRRTTADPKALENALRILRRQPLEAAEP